MHGRKNIKKELTGVNESYLGEISEQSHIQINEYSYFTYLLTYLLTYSMEQSPS